MQLQREEALRLVREEAAAQQASTHSPVDAAPRHEEPRHEEPRHEEPRHEEPRVEAAPPVERPAPPPAPRIDAKEELADSGLVMIETDRSRAPSAPAEAEEPQHLGRPRRERKPEAAPDEPLQQVETRK